MVYRGGDDVWIAGRGGAILKRSEPLSPNKIVMPKLPPVLRAMAGRPKLKPRVPLITITDDGDIPMAAPPEKKEN